MIPSLLFPLNINSSVREITSHGEIVSVLSSCYVLIKMLKKKHGNLARNCILCPVEVELAHVRKTPNKTLRVFVTFEFSKEPSKRQHSHHTNFARRTSKVNKQSFLSADYDNARFLSAFSLHVPTSNVILTIRHERWFEEWVIIKSCLIPSITLSCLESQQ